MANSPSEKWENGVLVRRAIETNRWKVPSDDTDEPAVKAVVAQDTENKSVKAPSKKKK